MSAMVVKILKAAEGDEGYA